MNQVWVFIIGVLIGAVAVFVLRRRLRDDKGLGEGGNLFVEQAQQKAERRQKILEFLKGKPFDPAQGAARITNRDVGQLLGVSDVTAERYLHELEKEQVLRQVGDKGGYVYYEVIK